MRSSEYPISNSNACISSLEKEGSMFFFFDDNVNSDQYETLQSMMERWETETVEFKEARSNFDTDKIGRYFSALSNEANLADKQFGWLVFGVSEQDKKHIVGTSYKAGNVQLLDDFKYEISRDVTDGMTFLDIIELFPKVEDKEHRVLMFKIPAAVAGMPTEWKGRCYARSGSSLVPLAQNKVDIIRNKERNDWSRSIMPGATIEHLDKEAIALARKQYKEHMNKAHITEEIDLLSDEAFLTKLKLMRDGKVTNAAMVLLGNPDHDDFFERAPIITWRLISANGEPKDYEHFTVPFLKVADKVFGKIRNLTYRYMPNQLTLFPKETEQYDTWLLRELMNNCIAHSNYQLGGRIYINECDDKIVITNPGNFLPESIENVLKPTYNPPFYRNQLLSDAMVRFNMIDTATSGIKKVFRIQKDKFFPMPDYDLSDSNQVAVTVYGKILDDRYTHILYDNPSLDIEKVYLLDQVQKGNGSKLSEEAIKWLRKQKLIEGRKNNLYLSSSVAKSVDEEAAYIKNRAFNNKYYKDLIIEYLKEYGSAQRADLRKLLFDKFPDTLKEEQKEYKLTNLLTSMKKAGIIKTNSNNQQLASWILA